MIPDVYINQTTQLKGSVSMNDNLEVVGATTLESTVHVGKTMTVKEDTTLLGEFFANRKNSENYEGGIR